MQNFMFWSTESLTPRRSNHALSDGAYRSTLSDWQLFAKLEGSSSRTPFVCLWGVVPILFDYKRTLIYVRHLSTNFHWISTPNIESSRLRQTSTSWTSVKTSWTFLDVFMLIRSKWLIHIIFCLKKCYKSYSLMEGSIWGFRHFRVYTLAHRCNAIQTDEQDSTRHIFFKTTDLLGLLYNLLSETKHVTTRHYTLEEIALSNCNTTDLMSRRSCISPLKYLIANMYEMYKK